MSNTPFSTEEYARRLAGLRQEMERRGVDVLVVDEAEHVGYLTGHASRATRYQFCVVPSEADPIMHVRSIDRPTFLEQSWLDHCVSYGDAEDETAVLRQTLVEHGWDDKRLGLEIDSHFLTVQRYQSIQAALPRATLVDCAGLLWQLRLRKSSEEILYHRKAARIVDAAMAQAVDAAREGTNEREVALAAYSTALVMGADNATMALITSGDRTHSLHGSLGRRRLQTGDLLHVELLPQVLGYTSRLMRPTSIGSPSRARREAARRIIEVQDEQIAAMRPGAAAREIDTLCREPLQREGLRESYDNVSGYTLGYVPMIGIARTSDFTRAFLPTSDWTLEEGMVFHMYASAQGMTFSETVLVTGEGAERLTKTERTLFVR